MTAKGAKCNSSFTILLEIQEVTIRAGMNNPKDFTKAVLFWDPGATLSLCTHQWAKSHNFRSRPTTIYLKVVNKMHE